MLTHQEIFDKVSKHLLTQMKKSIHYSIKEYPNLSQKYCVYRGYGNTMCAVGALIPDEIYSPSMERNSIVGLFSDFSDEMHQSGLSKTHVYLLEDLQRVHDENEPFAWHKLLKNIALLYNLRFNFEEKL